MDECEKFLMTFPTNEINNMTCNFEELVASIWYRDPISYEIISRAQEEEKQEFDLFVQNHTNTRFKGPMKCFTTRLVNVDQGPEYSFETFTVADSETEGVVLTIRFKENPISPFLLERYIQPNLIPDLVKVYAHPIHTDPREYLAPALVLNITLFDTIILTYQEVENILLEPPYPSACRDYNSNKVLFSGQKECIETCLDMTPRDGLLSPSTVKNPEDPRRVRQFEPLTMRKRCVAQCPLSCHRTEHFVHVGVAEEQGDRTVSLASGEPETTVQFKPRTETFEFVIFVSSCFNLWFGVSFYLSTIDFCSGFNKRFIEKPDGSGLRDSLLYFNPRELWRRRKFVSKIHLRLLSGIKKIPSKIRSQMSRIDFGRLKRYKVGGEETTTEKGIIFTTL